MLCVPVIDAQGMYIYWLRFEWDLSPGAGQDIAMAEQSASQLSDRPHLGNDEVTSTPAAKETMHMLPQPSTSQKEAQDLGLTSQASEADDLNGKDEAAAGTEDNANPDISKAVGKLMLSDAEQTSESDKLVSRSLRQFVTLIKSCSARHIQVALLENLHALCLQGF